MLWPLKLDKVSMVRADFSKPGICVGSKSGKEVAVGLGIERVTGTVSVDATVEVGKAVMVCTIEVEAAATAVPYIGVISSVVTGERMTQAVRNTIRVIEDNTRLELFIPVCSSGLLMTL